MTILDQQTVNTVSDISSLSSSPFLNRKLILVAIFFFALLGPSVEAFAGKHPYQELTDKFGHDIREILIKHGMPVRHDRGNPWFGLSAGTDAWIGGNPAYTIFLYQADEIPKEAKLEIIDYCIKLHESRGRKEFISIEMRLEERKHGLFKTRPYFDLNLNMSNQTE